MKTVYVILWGDFGFWNIGWIFLYFGSFSMLVTPGDHLGLILSLLEMFVLSKTTFDPIISSFFSAGTNFLGQKTTLFLDTGCWGKLLWKWIPMLWTSAAAEILGFVAATSTSSLDKFGLREKIGLDALPFFVCSSFVSVVLNVVWMISCWFNRSMLTVFSLPALNWSNKKV